MNRDVCISGKARNAVGQHLIALLLAVEDLSGVNVWISRVPSPSNPSDILSRQITMSLRHAGGDIQVTPLDACLKSILD